MNDKIWFYLIDIYKIFHTLCAFQKVTFILTGKDYAFVGQAQDEACGRIDLIDKHIARCEQTECLAGRLEEDRYSRLRSINKTADAPMHAEVWWRYLEQCRIRVPYTVRLNWIPLSGISAPSKRLTTRYRPSLISTLDRSVVEGTSRMRKEANRKNEEKYGDDEGWVFHDTNGLLISRARAFAPIFCFKARYIRKKKGKEKREKNGAGHTRDGKKSGQN